MSLAKLKNLGNRVLDLKKVATPIVSQKRSRFDDMLTSLQDIGLIESQMDTVDPVFWVEMLDNAINLKKKTNIQINWDGLRKEINNFPNSFKILSTL